MVNVEDRDHGASQVLHTIIVPAEKKVAKPKGPEHNKIGSRRKNKGSKIRTKISHYRET